MIIWVCDKFSRVWSVLLITRCHRPQLYSVLWWLRRHQASWMLPVVNQKLQRCQYYNLQLKSGSSLSPKISVTTWSTTCKLVLRHYDGDAPLIYSTEWLWRLIKFFYLLTYLLIVFVTWIITIFFENNGSFSHIQRLWKQLVLESPRIYCQTSYRKCSNLTYLDCDILKVVVVFWNKNGMVL